MSVKLTPKQKAFATSIPFHTWTVFRDVSYREWATQRARVLKKLHRQSFYRNQTLVVAPAKTSAVVMLAARTLVQWFDIANTAAELEQVAWLLKKFPELPALLVEYVQPLRLGSIEHAKLEEVYRRLPA